jgi:lipopolysaccharide/colanic/teichoic acid biosynthesis glycosyltransferase
VTRLSGGVSTEVKIINHSAIPSNQEITKNLQYRLVKRIIDVAGAIIGLLFFTPILIVIGILIKIESNKGPIFFKQQRVGKDGQLFWMIKIRSMVPNAEDQLTDLLQYNEIPGEMFKMKNDPRILKIGKFIRKTSLDEIPQLWNVIKGDMSLVGPRPPLPREYNNYTEYDKLRLTITPGCTGLWQVSGRNHLSFHEMVSLDLEYIRKRSVLYDIFILIKTMKVFVDTKNAY